MQKWEYMDVYISGNHRFDPMVRTVNGKQLKENVTLRDYLQKLGEDGWELVSIREEVYYLKRPKE